ncbi:vitamin K epoxide reductase family protein [Oerskovia flava]|uniref:vitamin K epoxide reductase family protein n=1 Tax=Oerskovia flava TaxID=2986422 RepID=UPI00223EFA08|nr:vitamin K epoxide reductase family protein [Oerskovia sp. JB1-3-2]
MSTSSTRPHDGGVEAAEQSDDGALAGEPATGTPGLSPRTTGWLLVVLGAVGFAGSLALVIERFLKLLDPDHVASCTLNVFIDCGAAMDSWQGSLLGFPNPVIGVAAFPVVVTTGVVLLAGARLPRWYWLALLGATTVATGLVVFLVWTSLYALGALCPYCMVVWAAMIPLFWYQVVHALQHGYLPAGEGLRRAAVANRHLVLALLYVALLVWVVAVMGADIVSSF